MIRGICVLLSSVVALGLHVKAPPKSIHSIYVAPTRRLVEVGASSALSAGQYSGSGTSRDPCARNLTSLYVFGLGGGDTVGVKNDDGVYSILWTGSPFTLFGTPYYSLFPSTNGAIFVGAPSKAYSNVPFPASGLTAPLVAPWWADGDSFAVESAIPGYTNAVPNNVYFRSSTSPSAADSARIASDVAASLPLEPPFTPSFIAVVTWFAIGHYSLTITDDKLNTFQAVLASDVGGRSFITLCYDNLVWDSSSDTNAATAGYNNNDGVACYSLPGSFSTPSDRSLTCGGRGGCYTFRVDPVPASPSQTHSASPTPSPTPGAPVLLPGQYSGSSTTRDPCCRGLGYFYPFGVAGGDAVMVNNGESGYSVLSWTGTPFKFYGTAYNTLTPSVEGLISVGGTYFSWSNVGFPSVTPTPLIAAFWMDLDTTVVLPAITGYSNAIPNTVYYRYGTTPSVSDRARIASDVATSLPTEPAFNASFITVVTWFAIGRYYALADMLDTFQATLASDTSGRSFVTLCYDNLVWDHSIDTSSGTAGFNKGDGVAYYNLPGSFSSPADLALSCNGRGGCYTFRVDQGFVADSSGTASTSLSSTRSLTSSPTASQTSSNSRTTSQSPTPVSHSQTPTQLPSYGAPLLLPGQYSGSSTTRDPCCHGLGYLYPFGVAGGDTVMSNAGEWGNAVLTWAGTPFKFFGTAYNTLTPSVEGLISVGGSYVTWQNVGFPAVTSYPLIAVFWMDLDTSVVLPAIAGYSNAIPNTVYYRYGTTPSARDRARIARDVATSLPTEPAFNASFITVVTWFAIGRWNVHADMLDTFQATLASDTSGRSFVTLCYDNLVWDHSDDTYSGTAGFNKGDGVSYYNLNGSFVSPADLTLSCRGRGGCYTFRVDQGFVSDSSSSTSASRTASHTPSTSFSGSQTRSPPSQSQTASYGASPTRTQTPTTAVLQQFGIVYHGGPIMSTTPLGSLVNTYLIWYTPSGTGWSGTQKFNIRNFLANLGGSAWWGVEGSYMDGTGSYVDVGPRSVVVAGEYTFAGGPTSANIWGTVNSVLTAGTFPTDPNGVYFVLTDAATTEGSFCSVYCGWHSYGTFGSTNVKYSFVGNAISLCPGACNIQNPGPNGLDGTDGMVSVIAHELAESVSDPLINAWSMTNGNENADACAWTFGTPLGYTPNGAAYNMIINSTYYYVQRNWANRPPAGYCSLV